MSTNYYRIPTVEEMELKKNTLVNDVSLIDLSPFNIERDFCLPVEDSFDCESVWDIFIRNTNIHLGKRSSGWKFCWNFHNNKYYSNKEELLEYIRLGRVVNEYGEEQDTEEFITMSLEWGKPDGWVFNEEYRKKQRSNGQNYFFYDDGKYDDIIIDGLRVSLSTDFN